MPLPEGWRRLSPDEKAEVQRLYLASLRGGVNSAAARELYYRLRGHTRAEVLGILTALGAEYAAKATGRLRAASEETAARGRRAAADGLARRATQSATGSLGERAAAWLRRRIESPLASYRVSPFEGRRSAMLHPTGDVWLSRHLHRGNSPGVIDGLRKALVEGARHSETATALAQRLRDEIGHIVQITDRGPPVARIADQVREIEREAYKAIKASGDPRASQRFAVTRAEFERYADTLRDGGLGTRAVAMDTLRKIEAAVRRNDSVAVEHAIKWHAWNKEQEHQRLIARTETGRAYSHAYVEASRDIPWVVAWEWNTDDDPCEECAAMGGEVMRAGSVVYPPLHPNCACFLTEVVDSTMEPTEDEWSNILGEEAA